MKFRDLEMTIVSIMLVTLHGHCVYLSIAICLSGTFVDKMKKKKKLIGCYSRMCE